MKKHNAAINILCMTILFLGILGLAESSEAANHYVRAGATGSANGNDWTNAYTALPASLVRGDTYYIATGSYSSYTFDDAESGSAIITIKKATVADHGTSTGWNDSYGTGQAVFAATLTFTSNYWVIDGNGTFTAPSRNTNDYGIKVTINSSDGRNFIMSGHSNITLRYIHGYNAQQGGNCSYNGTHRQVLQVNGGYTKIQNCYWQNSFQDGLVFAAVNYVLLERNVFEGLGLLPPCPAQGGDNHGQALMLWGGGNHVIRWNLFLDNDGQGVLGAFDAYSNVRVYGNVFYNTQPYGPLYQGVNGGYFDHYNQTLTNTYIYNNTFTNVGGTYPQDHSSIIYQHADSTTSNSFVYNNLFYNIQGAGLVYGSFTGNGYSAYGNTTSTPGGTNAQSGLTSAIFQNYAGYNFRLAGATAAGLDMTTQSWWNSSSNSFFGQLDDNTDMYGNVRGADGTWDRGAYEYVSGAPPITHTITPSAGLNGSISPNTSQTVNDGATRQFIVTPNTDFSASVGGTCGGSLVGTTYTTNAITSDCSVSVTFTATSTRPSPPPSVSVQ